MEIVASSTALPPEVTRRIAELGPNLNPAVSSETRNLFMPLVELGDTSSLSIDMDIPYGPDDRQKLDVFRPGKSGGPVILYFPGGGFTGGTKTQNQVFLANVGVYLARHGFTAILVNYRLAPGHQWPSGAQDVGSAVRWVRDNVAAHRGDPERIFLIGRSAGTTHITNYLFDPALCGDAKILGAVLLSGVYKTTTDDGLRDSIRAYFGEDTSLYNARSPLTHLSRSKVPLALGLMEFDPPYLATPTLDLAREVTLRDGKSPDLAWFSGHNHGSSELSLGSADDRIGAWIRQFLVKKS